MVSLLDIVGPVMVGPSSSHTAGACSLGLLARGLVGGTPHKARIELHGSFARTGGDAFMVIELDEHPDERVRDHIRTLPWVRWAFRLDKVSA